MRKSEGLTMLFRVLLLLVLVGFIESGQGNRVTPIPVTVWKCCRIGDSLMRGDGDADFMCTPGGSGLWAPLVYAPKRRSYLPVGTVPSHWVVAESQVPTCSQSTKRTLLRTTKTHFSFVLFANGSIWLQESQTLLPPTTFCVDTDSAMVCLPEESDLDDTVSALAKPKKKIRVKKCCGEGAAYNESTSSCVASSMPELTSGDLYSDNDTDILLSSGFPACNESDGGLVIAGPLRDFSMLPGGGLRLGSDGLSLDRGQFCVDRMVESSDGGVSVFACGESVPTASAGTPVERDDIRFTLYPIGLLVGTAFLAATLGAGFLMPSAHHALHWRCQTHYIACLLVGDLILAITQLASNSISGTACVTLAIMMHFFFLAAFFWLNTMCFNIWWTFRDFRPTSLEKRQEVCRLRVYEVFAWGGPLLIAGIAAGLDHLPPDPLHPFLRPRFGVRNCWFYGDMEIFTYFFGPVGILLFVNLLLFASTARQLTCGLWKREDVKSTTERAALGRVCMKLVVVMGVTWVADVISWAVGGPNYVWYIPDLINALQGVLIFIVVGCQPQVWAAVKKVWCLKKLRSNVTNTTGAPMHSSSQGLPSMGESITNNTIANTTSNVKIPMETVC